MKPFKSKVRAGQWGQIKVVKESAFVFDPKENVLIDTHLLLIHAEDKRRSSYADLH